MRPNPTGHLRDNGRRGAGRTAALTIRHGGKADVAFADSHVKPVTPDFASQTDNNLAGY